MPEFGVTYYITNSPAKHHAAVQMEAICQSKLLSISQQLLQLWTIEDMRAPEIILENNTDIGLCIHNLSTRKALGVRRFLGQVDILATTTCISTASTLLHKYSVY